MNYLYSSDSTLGSMGGNGFFSFYYCNTNTLFDGLVTRNITFTSSSPVVLIASPILEDYYQTSVTYNNGIVEDVYEQSGLTMPSGAGFIIQAIGPSYYYIYNLTVNKAIFESITICF